MNIRQPLPTPSICPGCNTPKDPNKYPTSRVGIRSWRKSDENWINICFSCIGKQRRKAVKRKGKSKKKKEFLQTSIFTRTKYYAKKLGVKFSISPDDIVTPEFCPVFNIPLVIAKGVKGSNDNSPTVIRIASSKGFIPGNVLVVSRKAARIKSQSTYKELKVFLQWLEEERKGLIEKLKLDQH